MLRKTIWTLYALLVVAFVVSAVFPPSPDAYADMFPLEKSAYLQRLAILKFSPILALAVFSFFAALTILRRDPLSTRKRWFHRCMIVIAIIIALISLMVMFLGAGPPI